MVAGKYYLTELEVETVCSALYDRICGHVDTEHASSLTEPMYLATYMRDVVLLCDMGKEKYGEKIQATNEKYRKNLLIMASKYKQVAEDLHKNIYETKAAYYERHYVTAGRYEEYMATADVIACFLCKAPMDEKTFEKYQELKQWLQEDGVNVDRFIEYCEELWEFRENSEQQEMEER